MVDPDLNGGELNIRVPSKAIEQFTPFPLPHLTFATPGGVSVSSGKVVKVGVEFSLVEPQGGIHFVIPEDPLANCVPQAQQQAGGGAGGGASATEDDKDGKDASVTEEKPKARVLE